MLSRQYTNAKFNDNGDIQPWRYREGRYTELSLCNLCSESLIARSIESLPVTECEDDFLKINFCFAVTQKGSLKGTLL